MTMKLIKDGGSNIGTTRKYTIRCMSCDYSETFWDDPGTSAEDIGQTETDAAIAFKEHCTRLGHTEVKITFASVWIGKLNVKEDELHFSPAPVPTKQV